VVLSYVGIPTYDGRWNIERVNGSRLVGQAKPVILVVEDDELLSLYAGGCLKNTGLGSKPRTPTPR
jgi:hypothetical protein